MITGISSFGQGVTTLQPGTSYGPIWFTLSFQVVFDTIFPCFAIAFFDSFWIVGETSGAQ